ncbi:hypothetical protein TREES_T100007326 [Tupaia chinensis]|uniref:Uncharacterized protein n=1 Tax=Tupaia chinensis TaxID=246437 RepID=L9L0H5_TUPCH|nr:hypothetical protein TREES_T100007326 [Tupaia chinensis]
MSFQTALQTRRVLEYWRFLTVALFSRQRSLAALAVAALRCVVVVAQPLVPSCSTAQCGGSSPALSLDLTGSGLLSALVQSVPLQLFTGHYFL